MKTKNEYESLFTHATSIDHRGGGNLPTTGTSPNDMMIQYETWNDALPDYAVPLKMIWGRWYDLSDVAAIVDTIKTKIKRKVCFFAILDI